MHLVNETCQTPQKPRLLTASDKSSYKMVTKLINNCMPIDKQKLIFARMNNKPAKLHKKKPACVLQKKLIKSGSVVLFTPDVNILGEKDKSRVREKHTASSASINQSIHREDLSKQRHNKNAQSVVYSSINNYFDDQNSS